jgi:hypothetical protein
VIARFGSVGLLLALAGCGFAHDEPVAGPYRLVAVDSGEQMSLCYSLDENCVGRVGPTVFEAGANDAYVVAARHPGNDKRRAEYFYLIRELDGPDADPSIAVRGPFDEATYRQQEARLGLPSFTHVVGGFALNASPNNRWRGP